jgi:hypothetical protein
MDAVLLHFAQLKSLTAVADRPAKLRLGLRPNGLVDPIAFLEPAHEGTVSG